MIIGLIKKIDLIIGNGKHLKRITIVSNSIDAMIDPRSRRLPLRRPGEEQPRKDHPIPTWATT